MKKIFFTVKYFYLNNIRIQVLVHSVENVKRNVEFTSQRGLDPLAGEALHQLPRLGGHSSVAVIVDEVVQLVHVDWELGKHEH